MDPRFEQFIQERKYLANVAQTTLDWYKHSLKWLRSAVPSSKCGPVTEVTWPPGRAGVSWVPRNGGLMGKAEMTKLFGCGEAGTPVPQVDPLDVKAAWDMGQSVKKDHPEGRVGIGIEVFKAHCKAGANIAAVTFRGGQLWILEQVAPGILAPWTKDGHFDDVIFHAIAQIPMEWIGVGIVRNGLPFDVEDFMRRVREAA